MLDKGPLKATHIDLQVINAPKLAQSQSLGLQAKDWEIRCVEAGGYYGGWRGVTGDSYRRENPDVAGLVRSDSARICFPRAPTRGSFTSFTKPRSDSVYRMEGGSEHAEKKDDENDDQREAFMREHGGYSCSHYVGTRRLDALNDGFDERMFMLWRLNCDTAPEKRFSKRTEIAGHSR